MAEAKAYLELTLEAYEASALLAYLRRNTFSDPDQPGGDELLAIAEEIERVIPEMSYTPPVEDRGEGEEHAEA